MNEIAVLESDTATDHAHQPPGDTGYELFGLGWRPTMAPSEYVGRHRAPDA